MNKLAYIVRADGQYLGMWHFSGTKEHQPVFYDRIAILYLLPQDDGLLREATEQLTKLDITFTVRYVITQP